MREACQRHKHKLIQVLLAQGGVVVKGIPCRLMERGGGERQEAWYNELFQQLAQIAEPRAEPQ